ncbi:MAG: hypothetical protein ABI207_06110 [Crocinitomicaceae bacterium]
MENNILEEYKSEEMAAIIMLIALQLENFDPIYGYEAAKRLSAQASRQESMLVLHPSYPMTKNDILREQAIALKALSDYKISLIKIQQLRSKLSAEMEQRENVNKLFM